jgi:ubiquinone/menaquinone biosynthesis C-methylase UbiE
LSGPRREWRGAARRAELLDDPAADAATVLSSLKDVARANRFLGGAAAPLRRLDELLRTVPAGTTLTLLDVGTGDGDIPRAARTRAARAGIRLRLLAVERHPAAARHAAQTGEIIALLADAAALPLASRSVDLVLCSQLLHHFRGAALTGIVAELARVARLGVVIADLRPNRVAAVGLWLASYPLGFRSVSRRDGVTSVLRGFTAEALREACAEAGVNAVVRSHAMFRVTAAWRSAGGNGGAPPPDAP